MVDLIARTAAAGLVPVVVPGVRLDETAPEAITSVAVLPAATPSVQMPDPGQTLVHEGRRILWSGRRQALVLGAPLAVTGAAVTDQSDAWVALTLSGARARDVLSRLVPIDLRDRAFPEAATARTLLQHVTVSLTRTAPDAYLILAFRSMAGTLVHDITVAMENAAAREG